jgi:hypothetical protein
MKRSVPPSSSGVPSVKNCMGILVGPSESDKYPICTCHHKTDLMKNDTLCDYKFLIIFAFI